MKRPLSKLQCILFVLAWVSLCAVVITSAPRVDGMLIVTILMSGALVFIPVYKSLKK
ncbi:MAG: hypothetical protein SPJ29_04535 [Phocaeicola sp.]|nr:hypothetical protein [Phocaeicola sp.]MDD7448850.1 hypothetical protein [Prevotellaceae bacterium]MDY3913592.1 hypothetical protein [Phocaeicola sp.]MDY5939005.1 hypothetical protein [Phocaeicola sp.]